MTEVRQAGFYVRDMAEYSIKLTDDRGHITEQVETGRSEAEVRDRLTSQGLLIVSVKPRKFISGGTLTRSPRRKVKLAHFVVFNQQMVTLVRAGLPILQALDLLVKQQRDERFRTILLDVRERVKAGELFRKPSNISRPFPKVYSTTLLAGEKSGNLEEVLNRYLHFQRLALSFRKKLKHRLSTRVIGDRHRADADVS